MLKHKFSNLKFVSLVFLIWSTAALADIQQNRSRMEELFIWKVSDALELPPKIETKFAQTYKRLTQERNDIAAKLEKIVEQINKTLSAPTPPDKTSPQNDKQLKNLVEEYRKLMTQYGKIQLDEIEKINNLLGPKRFAQYLILKHQLTQKLKTLLSTPTPEKPSHGEPLTEPKVIEEM